MSNPRDLFFTKVRERILEGQDIVVVTADLAAPSLDQFRREFKGRYISVGVAEQNLITVACGLAAAGKQVVVWGLNPFVITRALDQIRNTISLMKYPVVFAGLHAGLSSAISGPTHVVISDLTLTRTLANIEVYNPSDLGIAKSIYEKVLQFEHPYYLRLDKDITYTLERESASPASGFSVVKKGEDQLIISNGRHVDILADIMPRMVEDGLHPTLIDLYRFPCDKVALSEQIQRYNKIVTVEEHVLQGGLGSYVLEMMADQNILRPVRRIGIDMERGYPERFGGREYFQKYFGLDEESLIRTISDFFAE